MNVFRIMDTFFLKLIHVFFLVNILFFHTTMVAHAKSEKTKEIEGIWQTYDDVTGSKKALVQFVHHKKTDTYVGRIIKITPIPGYKPVKKCSKCPGTFKNKPLLGLIIVWNLKAVKENGKVTGYTDGRVLDPLSGKIYSFNAKLNADKTILKGRGYIGLKSIGRSQNWIRHK